jgi:hypothetical protein
MRLVSKQEKPTAAKVKPKTHPSPFLTDQILALREDGFFDLERTIMDIKIKLSERGFSVPVTTISPLLLRLVRKNVLKRTLTSEGFKYKKP